MWYKTISWDYHGLLHGVFLTGCIQWQADVITNNWRMSVFIGVIAQSESLYLNSQLLVIKPWFWLPHRAEAQVAFPFTNYSKRNDLVGESQYLNLNSRSNGPLQECKRRPPKRWYTNRFRRNRIRILVVDAVFRVVLLEVEQAACIKSKLNSNPGTCQRYWAGEWYGEIV